MKQKPDYIRRLDGDDGERGPFGWIMGLGLMLLVPALFVIGFVAALVLSSGRGAPPDPASAWSVERGG